jgi:hypothetical protein
MANATTDIQVTADRALVMLSGSFPWFNGMAASVTHERLVFLGDAARLGFPRHGMGPELMNLSCQRRQYVIIVIFAIASHR